MLVFSPWQLKAVEVKFDHFFVWILAYLDLCYNSLGYDVFPGVWVEVLIGVRQGLEVGEV